MALAQVIAHKIYHRKSTSLVNPNTDNKQEVNLDSPKYYLYKPKKTVEPDKVFLQQEFENNIKKIPEMKRQFYMQHYEVQRMEKIQEDMEELEDANNVIDSFWNHDLQIIVQSLMIQIGNLASQKEKAVRIHDFVRDHIKFGFTKKFDLSSTSETLKFERGHCIPKAVLFKEMLKMVGIEARLHFVTIKSELLFGVFNASQISQEISHCYTEVKLNNEWIKVDSYVIDEKLRNKALPILFQENKIMGYGVHVNGTGQWDGSRDAFSQFVDHQNQIISDEGIWESVEEFSNHHQYKNKIGPFKINTILGLIPQFIINLDEKFIQINQVLDNIRVQQSL